MADGNVKKSILIFGSLHSSRKDLLHEFDSSIYQIFEAQDEEDLFQIYGHRPIDLILFDTPDETEVSFSLCRRIREKNIDGNKTSIVFLYKPDQVFSKVEGFESGISQYFDRGFLKGELVLFINKLLLATHRFEGLHALVADDSEDCRARTRLILQKMGVKVIEAFDGYEAFEVLKSGKVKIDLLITDQNMPGINGVDLCKKVRGELNLKRLPIIFVSGEEDRKKCVEFLKAGATDYIIKPYIKAELLARLEVHLEVQQLYYNLQKNIEDLNKMDKVKNDFMSVLSHDLRNPIGSIISYASIIKMEWNELDEVHKEFVHSIEEAGNNLIEFINDVLDLSKLQGNSNAMKVENIELVEIVKQCCQDFQEAASKKNIEIVFDNECDDNAPMSGNKVALFRIVNNFVSNAIKFTHEGGKVTVHLDDHIGHHIVLSISDTGIGIPEDKIPILFEKFTGAGREGTAGEVSTGLGLNISKELIEKHGGNIEVNSVEGKGTTFTIAFPKLKNALKSA